VAGERVLGERTRTNSEQANTCFGCKAEDRTDGRRPGHTVVITLNKCWQQVV
jgi:hypothetical protein